MIKIKKLVSSTIAALGFATLFFTPGCSVSDFKDTDVNPNAVEVPLTSALLTNASIRMGTIANNQNLRSTALWFPGQYTQYFSSTQYTDESLYSAVEPSWAEVFAGPLKDLQVIIDINTAPETKDKALLSGSNEDQIAVARILKVYFFSHVTDMWGDIPYTDALQGEKQKLQPKYDSQQDVYKDFFKELKEATAQIKDGDIHLKGDILYGGDMSKWKKFANSLRLILALRISKADATLGAAEAKSAIASGVIENITDNAIVHYPGGTFKNPWYNEYDGRKDLAISDVIEKVLKDFNDPRTTVFGDPSAPGNIIGVPYGLERNAAISFTNSNPKWSRILAASYRKEDSPYDILTAADVYLARAEAAKRGWTTEVALTMYNNGIKASFQGWGVFDQTTYAAYIANPKVLLAGDATDLTKIATQRWLTFYPRGDQGWAEWRRTGIPALKPTPQALNSSKQIPRRYIYPTNEANLNGVSYKAAAALINGGDTADGRVWWDK